MKGKRGAMARALTNWKSLAGFEALYKMASVILFAPLLLGALALAMGISGFSYLTHENIGAFLSHPLTVLALLLILLLGAFYEMVDVSAVLFALDQSLQDQRVTPGQIFRFALKNTARAWRAENLPLIPVTLGLLPLVNTGLAAGVLATVSIPSFVFRYLRSHPALPALCAAVLVLATVVGLRWMYAVCCFTLEGRRFADARRQGAALGRGGRLGDLAMLIAVQAASSAVYMVFLLLVMALASLLGRSLSEIFLLKWLGASAVWLAIVLALSAIAALAVPVGYGCVGLLYFRRKALSGALPGHTAAPALAGGQPSRGRRRLLRIGAVCALTAGSLTIGFLLSTGGINPHIEYLRTTEITAHRGACALYPENTMAAFVGAQDLGADWIELDVQQSRDGQLVVTHDTNLKRVTGVNANTWDLTYEQIAALDAGSFFSPEFAGERIPLLTDVLDFAEQNGVKLNIELKPSGHETDLEKAVVDAIRDAGLEDACVVTSQAYRVLEALKAYDESITTVYVMRFAYGSIDKLSAADAFSVEARSVTPSLVSRVHNAGKGLYVWTVNTERSIGRMIELSVDNIITDNVDLAKQCIYESRYSDLLEDYVDLLQ